MNEDRRSRQIAAAATACVAAVIILLLVCCSLEFDPTSMPPSRQPVASVADVPEYVDFLESLNSPAPSDPAQAFNPEPANNAAQAAPEGGPDLVNAGAAAPPPAPVTSNQTAPTQQRERTTPPQAGPSQEEIEAEQARRQAANDMANAFNNPANDNTTNPGNTPGPAGNPNGTESPVNGNGSGTVGGGWIMPTYAKIPSNLTGSIRLRASIDAEGNVVRVEQIGGAAPASANAALVQKCIAEVRSKRYTRTDNNAPSSATALITYIFR